MIPVQVSVKGGGLDTVSSASNSHLVNITDLHTVHVAFA